MGLPTCIRLCSASHQNMQGTSASIVEMLLRLLLKRDLLLGFA